MALFALSLVIVITLVARGVVVKGWHYYECMLRERDTIDYSITTHLDLMTDRIAPKESPLTVLHFHMESSL